MSNTYIVPFGRSSTETSRAASPAGFLLGFLAFDKKPRPSECRLFSTSSFGAWTDVARLITLGLCPVFLLARTESDPPLVEPNAGATASFALPGRPGLAGLEGEVGPIDPGLACDSNLCPAPSDPPVEGRPPEPPFRFNKPVSADSPFFLSPECVPEVSL